MRGAKVSEIEYAIINGEVETVKKNRKLYRSNFQFNSKWQGVYYAIKQVAPVIVEEEKEIVVITVYTFYY
ncbi:MAG: DUF4258 domain-containing protein [Spirochaetia bacterium]|nr:DUF4258 domain-containing protein [Spirochaetia bacterium]